MKILIIESDQDSIRQLKKLLKEICPENQIAGCCSSIREAREWLKENKIPDLIFSVVELPGGLSFEIFREFPAKVPVIFVCRHEKYAIDAFKANGFYYLLKPIKKEELKEALLKYETNYSPTHRSKQRVRNLNGQERFLVSIGKQLKLIRAEEIAYFYTENKVVYIVTFKGAKYVAEFTLEQLESRLNPAEFFRINRQFIINLSSISKMIPASKSRVQVSLQPETAHDTVTSSGRTDNFYKWLLGQL